MFGCIRNTEAARSRFRSAAQSRGAGRRWAAISTATWNEFGSRPTPPECIVQRFGKTTREWRRREHTAHGRQRRALELARALPARTALPRTHHEVRREGLVDGDASVPGRGDHRFGHVQRELATGTSPARVRMDGANRIAFRRRSGVASPPTVRLRSRRHLSGFVAERSRPDGWTRKCCSRAAVVGRRATLAGRDAPLRASVRLDDAESARRCGRCCSAAFVSDRRAGARGRRRALRLPEGRTAFPNTRAARRGLPRPSEPLGRHARWSLR